MDELTTDQLLSPSDAAKLLDLTPAGVVAMARRGALPCLLTAGGRRLFQRRDVEAAAQSRADQKARITTRG